MIQTVKITTIGNSAGIILSKEVLSELNIDKGDTLHLSTENGAINLSVYDPEFEAQINTIDQIMREDREALRKLAE